MFECDFWLKKVYFLRHIISKERILVNTAKVQAVVEWSQLKAVIKIKSFLGLVDYYRRFIKNFSLVAPPMMTAPMPTLPNENEDFMAYSYVLKLGLQNKKVIAPSRQLKIHGQN